MANEIRVCVVCVCRDAVERRVNIFVARRGKGCVRARASSPLPAACWRAALPFWAALTSLGNLGAACGAVLREREGEPPAQRAQARGTQGQGRPLFD